MRSHAGIDDVGERVTDIVAHEGAGLSLYVDLQVFFNALPTR